MKHPGSYVLPLPHTTPTILCCLYHRRVYHRQQEYSAAEYDKWLDDTAAQNAMKKEQTERDALLAAAGEAYTLT